MMDYLVSEICGKDLTLNGIIDYEADTCTYHIFSGTKLTVKSDNITLQITLEAQLRRGVPLVVAVAGSREKQPLNLQILSGAP